MSDIISRKEFKARKAHTCHLCFFEIKTGEKYSSYFCKDGSFVYASKSCGKCDAIVHEFGDEVEGVDGIGQGAVHEAIKSNGCESPQELLEKFRERKSKIGINESANAGRLKIANKILPQ